MNDETKLKHGAIKRNPIHRWIRKLFRKKLHKLAGAPVPFDWTKGFDVETATGTIERRNQGNSESCGGQAGAYFLTIQRALQGIKEEISAKSIYAPIAYPTGGTTVTDLQKQICNAGANREIDVPSMQNGNAPTEQFMTDKSWMTSAWIKDALTRSGYTPVSINHDLDSIACAIRDYGGVFIELAAKNNGTWFSAYPKKPDVSVQDPSVWFHFMCGKAGILNGQKVIGAFQSWGASVGDNGVQYFTDDYITSQYFLDVFTFVKTPKYLFTRNLTWYSFGKDVWELQKRLIQEGVATFTYPTGLFFTNTFLSVKRYQAKYGIEQTGFCGELTRAQLNK